MRPLPRALLTCAALLLLAAAAHQLRRGFIRSFFRPGPVQPAPPRQAPAPAGPLRPARVLLIDGLSASLADRLPNLSALCRRGLDLRLDVGFPSVSLPVQHVLWTGAWQHTSGIQFIVGALPRPALPSLPAAVRARGGQAVAVAQSHAEIAASFPFSPVQSPAPDAFSRAALAAWRSAAALAFVHHLAVDDAGHKQGGAASAGYLKAAGDGDDLLARLLAITPDGHTVAVLSDHGHLPQTSGGHGGAEPAVRRVRACVAGPGIPAGSSAAGTLPDLTNLLARQLNVSPPARSEGATPADLLSGRAPAAAPLPGPHPVAIALAAALAILCLGAWILLLRRAPPGRRLASTLLSLPWGMLLAWILLLVMAGPPTLSHGVVFKAYPWASAGLLLPGLLLPALQAGFLRGAAMTQLPGIATLAFVPLCLTGFPAIIPPLLPYLTAAASVALLLTSVSLISLAAGSLTKIKR